MCKDCRKYLQTLKYEYPEFYDLITENIKFDESININDLYENIIDKIETLTDYNWKPVDKKLTKISFSRHRIRYRPCYQCHKNLYLNDLATVKAFSKKIDESSSFNLFFLCKKCILDPAPAPKTIDEGLAFQLDKTEELKLLENEEEKFRGEMFKMSNDIENFKKDIEDSKLEIRKLEEDSRLLRLDIQKLKNDKNILVEKRDAIKSQTENIIHQMEDSLKLRKEKNNECLKEALEISEKIEENYKKKINAIMKEMRCETEKCKNIISNVVKEFETDNSCNICTEPLKDPVALDCGHVFCGICANVEDICPFCRANIQNRRQLYII